MKLKELKRKLADQILEYPALYRNEVWVFDILCRDRESDECDIYAEWVPAGIKNNGEAVMRLSNFAILYPPLRTC